ncbi:LytR/AlgR family response regulator transcription factor [Chitinophaga niabensis]|uniref:LytTr DNA-binding domain-containing protein n=1 Tax=Chitinophaga niabensis TaxID=536979 RepID=A0A1N6FZ77_9BACT|nr:LytTR family DNA-binding domain-containing protein [Chitinophaga niabensis]SIO00537.1 LytTr DNA-binding domain-containing protein [Chitinophaga niabensis]
MMNQPFFIRDDRRLVRLNLAEIMILKSEDNYLRFLAKDYSYQVRATMEKTLSQLPEGLFVRIHRSFAVSLNYLEEIGKEKDLVVVGGVPLALSKQFYPELISRLNIIGGDKEAGKKAG